VGVTEVSGVKGAVVLTTVGTREAAGVLARRLVEGGLAACVQMLPMDSVYAWKGSLVEEPEILLLVKIVASRYAEVEAEIAAGHPYDTPEIVMLPLSAGLPTYLDWVAEQAGGSDVGTG
jgi:periplasmic divalent cation tolerance protein